MTFLFSSPFLFFLLYPLFLQSCGFTFL
ncbi:unnamed protein product [Spirodela intermedia]|uniref:Uncharacterized protein n=1 Tax=Spirodela intermedia TaxID=51605 RepID=A0A811G6K1_SPIIN|nr:unnamed protein product [Spirodela intermedia]